MAKSRAKGRRSVKAAKKKTVKKKAAKTSAAQAYKPLKAPKHPQPGLEAASPFEMRVNLAKDLPETDVQSALDSGDMGF
ncbi:MAG TPA: hypothetical protein VMV37_11070, partial [Gammaproteobacteria bacterium]|nr:hypothetical protein [Gammaproteobacteria bacterium]